MYIQRTINNNVFSMYDPDMSTFRETYPGEEYEPGVCSQLQSSLIDADAFLDIGALYGYFSLYVQCLDHEIPIYAFEPNRYYFKILEENIEKSSAKNIKCINAGLGENIGNSKISEKAMSANTNSNTMDISFPKLPVANEKSIFHKPSPNNFIEWLIMEMKYRILMKKPAPHSIKIIDFDNWIKNLNHQNIVAKIDIHGAEALALRGMKLSLSEGRFKKIFLEIHKPSILLTESYEEIFDFFDPKIYRILEIFNYRSSKFSIRPLNKEDIENFCKYDRWTWKQKIDMRMLIIERI